MFFEQFNDHIFLRERQPNPYLETVPVGTYLVNADMKEGFFLTRISDFELPSRIFGSTNRYAERILRTFNERSVSTGVLLAGEKGSGKSLLAKLVATQARQAGAITLVVANPFCGPDFNKFIQSFQQPATVLFDEFEKVYHEKERQQALLTLFDGMFPSKKLFVLTTNDEYGIDAHMRNRPGRLYYSLSFKGMEQADIEEYLAAMLKNPKHAEGVVKFSKLFYSFNFDMLKALVEEMNRYSEPASAAYKMLNAKPYEGTDSRPKMTVEITKGGKPVTQGGKPINRRGVPFSDESELSDNGELCFYIPNPEYQVMIRKTQTGKGQFDHSMESNIEIAFSPEQQVHDDNDAKSGAMVFVNEDGYRAVFRFVREVTRTYDSYLF